jgi:anti-sigma B factor antagonist
MFSIALPRPAHVDLTQMDMDEELKIETIARPAEGVRILRLEGPFILRTLFDFQSLVRGGDDRVTIIDLTGVPYIDSAALGCLIGVHTSAQRLKRRYAIVGAAPRILTLFNMVGVDKILVTYPTLKEAEAALLGGAHSA